MEKHSRRISGPAKIVERTTTWKPLFLFQLSELFLLGAAQRAFLGLLM